MAVLPVRDAAGAAAQDCLVKHPDKLFSLFLTLTNSFKMYDVNVALTNGGPVTATNTISVEIYKQAFEYKNAYGYSAALAVIVFLICVLIGVVQRKVLPDNEQ